MGRMERVNQQIKREISSIIQAELNDPRLQFVTLMSVDTSKDLRSAKVRYSVYCDPKEKDSVRESLEGARGIIRKYLGKRLALRNTPELMFVFDNSVEYQARIDETLKEIKENK